MPFSAYRIFVVAFCGNYFDQKIFRLALLLNNKQSMKPVYLTVDSELAVPKPSVSL